jgi:hypothetical protein
MVGLLEKQNPYPRLLSSGECGEFIDLGIGGIPAQTQHFVHVFIQEKIVKLSSCYIFELEAYTLIFKVTPNYS